MEMVSFSVSKAVDVSDVGDAGNEDRVGDGDAKFLAAFLRPGETVRKFPLKEVVDVEVELRLDIDLAVPNAVSLRGCFEDFSVFLSRCSFLDLRSGSVQTTSHMLSIRLRIGNIQLIDTEMKQPGIALWLFVADRTETVQARTADGWPNRNGDQAVTKGKRHSRIQKAGSSQGHPNAGSTIGRTVRLLIRGLQGLVSWIFGNQRGSLGGGKP